MWKTRHNRITAWLIIFCMLAGMTMTVAPITAHAAAAPWEGAGIEGDPYLIASAQDLVWVSDAVYSEYLGAYFEQTADIDLSGVPEWTPIGTFSGYYDGKGFAVRNLVINNPGSNSIGLFSVISGGTVDGLHLTGADITGRESVGILAGKIENSGKAVNCSAAGDVKGWQYVGGLVGHVEGSGSMITDSSSEGTVTGSGNYTGGLAGNNRGQIERCFSACAVNSSGLYIGGLAGANWNGGIRNSYATGNVTGSSNVGGLIGWHGTGNTVEKSYSTGFVSGGSSGGLIGVSSSATVSDSYYSSSSGKSDSGKGASKPPADLKKQSTFTGWDFTNVWKIGEEASAPTLRWQSWSADERVTADWSALTWDAVRGTNSAADDITASVVLPVSGAQGSSILWDAAPQGYIHTETGAVTRPENENVSVTLTAAVSYADGTSRTKAFALTVKKTVTDYYAVTYSANGGAGTPPTESDKGEGEYFTAAAADAFTPPEGKQFKEWNTSADGSGDSYKAQVTVTMPAHALNLYAIWRDALSAAAGSALGFDGADDYINAGALHLANRSFSIDFWLKRGAAGQQYVVSQGESDATGQTLHIGFREDNKFTFAFWGDDIDTAAGYDDTAWHHWAVTYDETTGAKKIYRDGILVKTGTANGSYTGNGTLFIGKRFDGYNFKGELDELRIWGEARTEKQIRETMHNTLADIPDELLAYYQFNENTGTHTADAISTANKTLSNFNMNANSGWLVSAVPTGGGTAASVASFQSGTQALGNIAIDVTEPFDNASDVYANEIANPPNSSTGIGGTLYPDKYWIVNAFGSPGTFTASLTFTLPAGFITQEDIDNPENLALYGRESHSAGPWSLRARAASATATAVTFEGITSFGPFAISSYSDPTVQASGVSFSGLASAAMNISWTNGNGESRMVLMKAGSAVDGSPADKTGYTAHGVYGSGDPIGSGNYVVYAGSGNSVAVTGLNPDTAYYVAVYEYNGAGSSANYLAASPAVGNATTLPPGTYTATYYANGGTGDAVIVPDITEGTPYTLAQNTFTPPAGKRFKEWNTSADGSGDGYGAEATVTMPGTPLALYAIWEIEWVGDGSQSDPYQVVTAEHLDVIAAKSLTAYYIQTADINLTGIWEPVGTYDTPFTGSYDGGGHTVNNLIINKQANNDVGFFGFVSGGGTIKNLRITGANVTGGVNVGILVGIIADGGGAQGGGSIIDCSTVGTVAGTSRVGGLIGSVQNSGASVKRSHSAASVSSVLGGSLDGSAGGFAGFIYQGLIEDCYSAGSVTAGTNTGGFAGHMQGGQVKRSYSAASVSGGYARGFISYVTGGAVEASYYNSDTGLSDPRPLTARTAAQLKLPGTFTTWDFNNVWYIWENNAFPILRWQLSTVVYHANNGTGEVPVQVKKMPGELFFAADSTFTAPAGKQLKEWNTSPVGVGDAYTPGATVTMTASGLALYAIWESLPVTGIAITTPPSKTDYFTCDSLDLTGLAVTGTYSDGFTETLAITAADITGFDSSLPEVNQGITISYGGSEATFTVTIHAVDWEGDGSAGNPYKVTSPTHLNNVRSKMGAGVHFEQTTDIDLFGVPNWTPIGDSGTPFTGIYDGNSKTISNLTVDNDAQNYTGLFGYVGSGGTLTSIKLTGVDIRSAASGANVGGLAGMNEGAISGSSSEGDVSGGISAYIGGLVGNNYGAVFNSSTAGSVNGGEGAAAGGLIGNGGGTVTSSYYLDTTASSAGGTALAEAELKQQAFFTGWDFAALWKIGENVSYPTLQWQPWTPDERITADRTAMDWDDIDGDNSAIDNVTTDLVLPTSGAQGSTITWSAEPDTYIDTAAGTVTRPPDADKTITLTATVSYTGGANQMKAFTLTVIREFRYSVTYHANNGTGTAPAEADKAEGAAFAAANNTFAPPSGKKFKHWYTNPIGTGGTAYVQGAAVTMPAGGLILYALWEDDSPEVKRSYLEVITLAGGTVRLNGNETPISPVFSLLHTVGAVIRLEAVANPGYTFEYWLNVKNSSVISADPVYEANVGAGINVMAVFSKTPAAEDTHFTVTFKDRSGKLLQSTSVTRNGTVTPPAPLVWEGYDFSEWSRVFDSVASDLVITAIYVRADTTYGVTVENGSLSTGGNEGSFKFDIPVTVVADTSPDGQQFSHWEQDGKKVSTKPAFTFYTPMRDTTLTAVFAEGDTVLENAPFITLSDDVMSNTENGTITFTAIKDVPAGYTLVECGVLLLEADAPLGGELTVDTGNVILGKILDPSTNQFYIMKAHVEEGDTWHGRAYLIYKDGDGNPFTVYSDNTVYKTLQR